MFALLPGSAYARKFLTVELPAKTQARVPSYLSSPDFVSGLLTYVVQSAAVNRAQAALAFVTQLPPEVKKMLPAAVAAADSVQSLVSAAKTDMAALQSANVEGDLKQLVDTLKQLGGGDAVFARSDAAISEAARLNLELASAIDVLSPAPLRDVLVARLRDADGNYQRFITSVQRWFDDYMDRVSGWYKRCAGGYRGAGKNCVVDLRALSVLPLGWPDYALGPRLGNRLAQHTAQAVVPAKLLGWTFTIVVLALGAPFWFDLLGTIVNVRNAGSVPPRSAQPAESSRLS